MFLTPTGSDVVLFVFMPQKFDDLPFPLHISSSIFPWLESSFLRTFAVSCEFSINHDNYCRNLFEFSCGRYKCSFKKSAMFKENSRKQRPTFVEIPSRYFCTVLYNNSKWGSECCTNDLLVWRHEMHLDSDPLDWFFDLIMVFIIAIFHNFENS